MFNMHAITREIARKKTNNFYIKIKNLSIECKNIFHFICITRLMKMLHKKVSFAGSVILCGSGGI